MPTDCSSKHSYAGCCPKQQPCFCYFSFLFLNERNDSSVIGLVDEVYDLVGFQDLYQSLDLRKLFVAFKHSNNVHICFSGFGIALFMSQRILAYREACFQCIVSVQDHIGGLIHDTGNLLCCQFYDLDVIVVLFDIVDGSFQAYAFFQLDDAIVLQKQKSSCFVCGIIRNCDGVAVCDVIQAGFGSRIDSEGLIMDTAGIDQVGSFFFI